MVLYGGLVAGDARDADDVRQGIDRPAGLDGIDRSPFGAAQAHARSPSTLVTAAG